MGVQSAPFATRPGLFHGAGRVFKRIRWPAAGAAGRETGLK